MQNNSSALVNIPVLYQDDDILVINKPSGIVVNRAESVKERTIQDWISSRSDLFSKPSEKTQAAINELNRSDLLNETFFDRVGIVHRIDKETSGCLIIAKNPDSFFKLQALFKNREVKKTYVALVHGKLVPQTGEINAPIGRLPWNREQFGVIVGGKEAVTRYKVVHHYSSSDPERVEGESRSFIKVSSRLRSNNNVFSLVELYPETGRTHQIRVHLKYLGFPIVGDYLYAGRKLQKSDREWCPRVFLHALKISFPHPATQKIITVEAPLPEELEIVLSLFNN